MRALSLQQPWADLIVAGIKPVENRSWSCAYRGPLLIHAGKRIDWGGYELADRLGFDLPDPDLLQRGGIVGQVELVNIIRDSRSPWAVPGLYHWQLASPRSLPFMPLRGQLGLFLADLPVVEEVLAG